MIVLNYIHVGKISLKYDCTNVKSLYICKFYWFLICEWLYIYIICIKVSIYFHQSGLTEAVRNSEIDLNTAERTMMKFIEPHIIPSSCPLAGNSIHCDKAFLQKYMPNFMKQLHYRIIDVSSIKELCRYFSMIYITGRTPIIPSAVPLDLTNSLTWDDELVWIIFSLSLPPPLPIALELILIAWMHKVKVNHATLPNMTEKMYLWKYVTVRLTKYDHDQLHSINHRLLNGSQCIV